MCYFNIKLKTEPFIRDTNNKSTSVLNTRVNKKTHRFYFYINIYWLISHTLTAVPFLPERHIELMQRQFDQSKGPILL